MADGPVTAARSTAPEPTGDALWPQPVRRFPGRAGHLVLPATHRAAALTGLRSYSPCVPKAVLGQRVALLALRLGVPRVVGPVTEIGSGLPGEVWGALVDELRTAFPRLAGVVPVLRRQPDRPGVALLLLDASAGRLGFVKVAPGEGARDVAVLGALGGRALRAAAVPQLLSVGGCAGWHWFVTEPLPDRLSRMGDPPLAVLAEDVATILAGLPRPADVPAHWQPMHGDFTPWNVRFGGDRFHVFDWQDHGFGPPWADAVLYEATRAVVDRAWPGRRPRGRVVPGDEGAEAREFWRGAVERRGDGTRADRALASALVAQFREG